MNLIAERVKVTDASGHEVDVKAALSAPVGAVGADETDGDEDEADGDEADGETDAESDAEDNA
jgi:hypothetical protein